MTLPRTKTAKRKKLYGSRGWFGCFVALKSEAMCLIWDPQKKTFKRVGVAMVEDGTGLDDKHNHPSYRDRVPIQDVNVDDIIGNDLADQYYADQQKKKKEEEGSSNVQPPVRQQTNQDEPIEISDDEQQPRLTKSNYI